MDGLTTCRIYNKCSYDIGITLLNGQQPVVRTGSFLQVTVNDILYIESIARTRRPFSSGQLAIVSNDGKPLTLEEVGGYTDPYSEKHFSQEEITQKLNKSVKQVEAWLETISDPIEIHEIIRVAKEMDLSNSKMKLLVAKSPEANLFDE